MELWIRSQSKETLLEEILATTESEFDERIGTYKSKERALEILDEIQNSILGILTLEDIEEQEIKKYTGKATFSKITNSLVYIMPEE